MMVRRRGDGDGDGGGGGDGGDDVSAVVVDQVFAATTRGAKGCC